MFIEAGLISGAHMNGFLVILVLLTGTRKIRYSHCYAWCGLERITQQP